MYERFYDELFESGSLTIKGMKAPNMYTILDTSSEDQQSMEFTVTVLDVDTASAIADCSTTWECCVNMQSRLVIAFRTLTHPLQVLTTDHNHFVTNQSNCCLSGVGSSRLPQNP
jgi:hypothetical protein